MAAKQQKKKEKMSDISLLHYYKLVFRSLLFLAALAMYIYAKIKPDAFETTFSFTTNDLNKLFSTFTPLSAFLLFVWFFEIFEMILRFFPSRFESMGCQKQFKRNYMPREGAAPAKRSDTMKGVVLTGVLWVLLIAVFGVLHFALPNHFDQGILLLIALIFSICDMICILFFCPFHTWFMKNKCCGSCRIYNWDYLMMFSPLIFIPSWYTWTLVAFALALFFRWELTAYMRPERFSEATNEALMCKNCPEKLCHHKRQLRHYLKKYHALAKTVAKEIGTTIKDKTGPADAAEEEAKNVDATEVAEIAEVPATEVVTPPQTEESAVAVGVGSSVEDSTAETTNE